MKYIQMLLLLSMTTVAFSQPPTEKDMADIAQKYYGISLNSGKSVYALADDLRAKHNLTDVYYRRRTHDSLFYMRGVATSFNPFAIPVTKVEFQLRENWYVMPDGKRDTLLALQILGVADTTIAAADNVREEYARIQSDFAKVLYVFRKGRYEKKEENWTHEYALYSADQQEVVAQLGYGLYYRDKKSKTVAVALFFRTAVNKK
ncbi:hypothetical protein SAMN05421788_103327 [Filimonas lacunae]|uniref:TATA-box binding n=1 Tax=Filimonas lacunae TaxID=477680 RepID=A0A173MK17_9BACT|nr:hypothetical protein [Filimonas lacunae]BAV07983.1 hypothetical protein FLA_4016 [Filimonas lacunae]SIT07463.1 hypothetical protein SAMN05421788_103327 [Filimonas lacunae]